MVPPYCCAEGLVVDDGAAVEVGAVVEVAGAGLAVVEAGATVVVVVTAGLDVGAAEVAGAVVVEGELQPIIKAAHKTKRHKGIINFFILNPPHFILVVSYSLT